MFPAVLDCRPIDLDGVLRDSGFEIRRSTTRSLAGIPVRIVVAVPLDFKIKAGESNWAAPE